VKRAFKLIVLIAVMAALGFGVVLIIDVGSAIASRVSVGSVTVSQLIDKVKARVLDDDVPEARRRPESPRRGPAAPARRPSSSQRPSTEPERAPLPAPRPEEYARDVDVRPDPAVEEAKARLDALLGRL